MATIVRPEISRAEADPWATIAGQVAAWSARSGVAVRDLVVLVPFVQLLDPARRAFAASGGWMPRIETTRTLAASLGPPVEPGSGELGQGLASDRLLVTQMLAGQPWAREWARRDPRGFGRAASRVVATAQQLVAAAAAVPPGARDEWWAQARDAVRGQGGPGVRERLLAGVAIEWAARSAAPATDRLFALRPVGWVAVVAGGTDPLTRALLACADVPTLVVDTDVSLADPFGAAAGWPAPAAAVCDGFEDEASAAAAEVIVHVDRAETPVALIAQDRVLVRRIRALLERRGVAVRDETGWKLATTRAGAVVMATLAAARRGAGADAWLDWLKSMPFALERPGALAALEAALRRLQVADASAIAGLQLESAPASLRDEAVAVLAGFSRHDRRALVDWLDGLAEALDRTGTLQRLRDDAAGRQALAALGIEPAFDARRRARLAADLEPLSLAEFTGWLDELLESETFLPPDPTDAEGRLRGVDVVITPLARAMLRPFRAVVLPGADNRQLGAMPMSDSLLPAAALAALGIDGPAERRDAEILAFVQVLQLPRVTLLRRRADGGEPLVDSVLVERLRLALAEQGRVLGDWPDPRPRVAIAPAPIGPGVPVVPAARLPTRLSASTFEALRDCPYRFFSRSILGLREADELDPEVEKRDYGQWLHEVLLVFHRERDPGAATIAGDVARLLAIGAASRQEGGIVEAAFLPFSASFEVLAPRYVRWLHEREAQGAAWADGEVELTATPVSLEGIELHGRIDRIDAVDGGRRLELIDYKTGGSAALKAKVREPGEDTQLAFYAALVGAGSELPLRAFYLALDGTHGLDAYEHVDVQASAEAIVEGIGRDMRRLREGAPLRPLGEGSTCEYCEARGLCRRDHWSDTT